MKTPPLSPALTTAVLNHLNLAPAAPNHAFLDALLNAYVRTVPWESVFRIVKWEQTAVGIIPALERAFASGKPACVNVSLDKEGMTKTSASTPYIV